MPTTLQLKIAKDCFWESLRFKTGYDKIRDICAEAYPDIYTFTNSTGIQAGDILPAIAAHDLDELHSLIQAIIETCPSVVYEEGEPYYSFEMVGNSLIRLKTELEKMLIRGDLTEQGYIAIYEHVAEIPMYKEEVFDHCFLDPFHIKNVFSPRTLEVFEYLHTRFKSRFPDKAAILVQGVDDIGHALKAGRYDLHDSLMEDALTLVSRDKYAMQIPTKMFWKNITSLVELLDQKNDPQAWKAGLHMATEVYGIQRYAPLKEAVTTGEARRALEGQVALFLAAKRQGYVFSLEEVRVLLEPIEKLAKAIGSDWFRQIPVSIGKDLASIVGDMPKKDILSGRRSKNLIASLNELMPGTGWMDFSMKRDRKEILMRQMDL